MGSDGSGVTTGAGIGERSRMLLNSVSVSRLRFRRWGWGSTIEAL